MLIRGEWWTCDDGASRPTVRAWITDAEGGSFRERFIVDSGSDRTVFRALLLESMRFSTAASEPGLILVGIGGSSGFQSVSAVLEFLRDDGELARVRGRYSVFTDPAATDMSILGRDVLDNFDVILSRPRNEVLLLAPNYRYRVVLG
jgi:hypothetical protein